jgi:3-hydroxyisobutyrate dehydrogenase-like beta-hydroxyacid dehydrogenase
VPLVLYNRTRSKAQDLQARGVVVVDRPCDLLGTVRIVMSCLHGPAADRSVFLGDASLTSGPLDGLVVVNTSTVGPDVALELARAVTRAQGRYVDAALMGGGREAALAGQVVMPVGGDPADVELARPLLDLVATTIEHTGPVGTAQAVKLVNNMMVAVAAAALAEAVRVADASAVDPEVLRCLLPLSSSHSHSMDRYLDAMLDRTVTARGTLRTLAKDAALAVALASSSGVEAAVVTAAADRFARAVELGYGDLDVPALVRVGDPAAP